LSHDGLEEEILSLLQAWSSGDEDAQRRLVPLVYDELRRLAHYYRKQIRAGDTMCTTALVHEVYLRLNRIGKIDWSGRNHFFALSALLMRRILVDIARSRVRQKRGGSASATFVPLTWDSITVAASEFHPESTLSLDEALSRLGEFDQRKAKLVELRVFGGLNVDESASVLGISPATVGREWRLAKAWLLRELTGTRELP
jgi:RNA polymerase sigma factor (TIGR02999 family)